MIANTILAILGCAFAFFGFRSFMFSMNESMFETAIHGDTAQIFWPSGLMLALAVLLFGLVFDWVGVSMWIVTVLGLISYAVAIYDANQGRKYWLGRKNDDRIAYKWHGIMKKRKAKLWVQILIFTLFLIALIILILT